MCLEGIKSDGVVEQHPIHKTALPQTVLEYGFPPLPARTRSATPRRTPANPLPKYRHQERTTLRTKRRHGQGNQSSEKVNHQPSQSNGELQSGTKQSCYRKVDYIHRTFNIYLEKGSTRPMGPNIHKKYRPKRMVVHTHTYATLQDLYTSSYAA